MNTSFLKRGALALGGAALLLSATIGFSQAQTATPTTIHRTAHRAHHELQVAATAIGIADIKTLRKELAGTTLTAVAQNHGVQPSTVAAALKADVDARIQARLDAGAIKAKRAATLKVKAEAKVDAFMTRQFKAAKAAG